MKSRNLLNKEFGAQLNPKGKGLNKDLIKEINKADTKELYKRIRQIRIEYYKKLVESGKVNQKYLRGLIDRAKSFNKY